ncbi:MAG: Smr/MutS family protein [Rhodospirillaceae bacterium]|nr:Smr/MutS family protein [Rhodospirillaceae bacterium]MDE0618631.1 Smr/MutS family protein [Rhodospirillaceae bacterium]
MSGRKDSRGRKATAGPAGNPAGPGREDDDARLWENVTRSVKPLARKGRLPEVAAPAPPAPRRPAAEKAAAPEPADAGRDSGAARQRVDISGLKIGAQGRPPAAGTPRGPAGLDYGDAPGVDKRTATRFRRGLMPIDARLDLHGHTQNSGRAALAGFLQAHRAAGRRCVLVVTGKGLKDDWSVGALRQALPGWLNSPDLRRLILAYCQAQPHHGGSGAVYILLRRERGRGGAREGD